MTLIVLCMLLPFVLPLLAVVGRRLIRWRSKRTPAVPAAAHQRCRCGYTLDQLDTIRCPECGRVSGFDATADDLELTDEQLRRAKQKRDARRAAAGDA